MPEVKVSHPTISGDDAKKRPRREPVPDGQYAAIIMGAPLGGTSTSPPLQKLSIEFQVLYAINEDKSHDDTYKGRRVYQDYILEHDAANQEWSEKRRWQLRMLLDASEIPFTDSGFNSDHLVNKTVLITVYTKAGKERDADTGEIIQFTNIKRVDSLTQIADSEIL